MSPSCRIPVLGERLKRHGTGAYGGPAQPHSISTPSLVHVKVFGRLHDDPIHTRRRQAFEKRQWTKSREVGRLRCGGLYEGLIGTRTPMRTVERRVMPSPSWNQRAPTTRACWHRS